MKNIVVLLFSMGIFVSCSSGAVRPSGFMLEDKAAKPITLSGDGRFIYEDLYTQALNLASEGFLDLAVKKLKTIIQRGGKNKTLYETLLGFEVQLLQQSELSPDEEKQKVQGVLLTANHAVQSFPDELKLRYYQVEVLRISGHYDEFYRGLLDILKKNAKDVFANYYIGAYYFVNDQKEKARGYFVNVLLYADIKNREQDLYRYQSYYYLGLMDLYVGNFDSSITFFKNALKLHPDDTEILQYLVLAERAALNFQESIKIFNKIPALYHTPELLEDMIGPALFVKMINFDQKLKSLENRSLFVAAYMEYRRGDNSQALANIRKWFDKSKNLDFYSFYLRYLILLKLKPLVGKKSDARKEVMQLAFVLGKKAKEMNKNDLAVSFLKKVELSGDAVPDIYWLIGSVYDDAEKPEKAIAYYKKYLNHPDAQDYATMARLRMSFLLNQTGASNAAMHEIKLAKKLAKSDQEQYRVYFYSGLLHAQDKQEDLALQDYQVALKYSPKNENLLYFIASIRIQQNDLDDAVKILQKALGLHPDSARLQNLLAYAYALSGIRYDRAVQLVNQALQSEPESLAYLDTLGWIYFRQGENQKALKTFRKVEGLISQMSNQSDLKEIFEHLAVLYRKLGLHSRADYYEQRSLPNKKG